MVDPEDVLRFGGMEAVVFDMDGVVTDTAGLHTEAWEAMFNEYLQRRAEERGEPFRPFTRDDYLRYVDGKPRYDGVRDFLASRQTHLPEGDPTDPPDNETISGLGNRKNQRFLDLVAAGGAKPFRGTIDLIAELRGRGVGVAVITSSRNGEQVLTSAGVRHLFPVKVDGLDSARLGLAGKPEPDIFLEASRLLGASPERTAVVEDAESGVEAGRRGGFGLVVGVNRGGHAQRLHEMGADLVVDDLSALLQGSPITELPSGLGAEMARELEGRSPALFLDYDGTLTPIAPHPDQALLGEGTRAVLERLAARHPVAIVSGRDRAQLERLVSLDGVVYAGSHGFDISGPGGLESVKGAESAPSLSRAAEALEEEVERFPGAWVERKRLTVAVHFRQAPPQSDSEVEEAVRRVASTHPDLRVSGGKKVFELRPAIEWDKGRAILHLIEVLDLDRPEVIPLYLGDDETDEDAFRVLRSREGIGIFVGREPRRTLARYALAGPEEVTRFLAGLSGGSG